MKSHLRVKVYALSHEMRYIRRQENKWKQRARNSRQRQKQTGNDIRVQESQSYAETNFWTLRNHRKSMKSDARNTHLAYGFMRGVPYSRMEQLCYGVYKGYGVTEPQWSRIEAIVEKFSKDEPMPQVFLQAFHEWLEDAKKWYEGNKERIRSVIAQRAKDWDTRLNDPDYQVAKQLRHKEQEILGRAKADGAFT